MKYIDLSIKSLDQKPNENNTILFFFSSKMEQYNEMIKFWNLELKNEKKKPLERMKNWNK